MSNKLIDKLNPYEIFLMEAAGENTNKLSEISVELIVPKPYGDAYLKMNVPEEMKVSGLVTTIGASKITECNAFSGNRDSGELHNHTKYNVITPDFNRTLGLIRNYKDKN